MRKFGTVLVTVMSALTLEGAAASGSGASVGSGGPNLLRVSGPTPFPVGCDGQPAQGTLYPNAEVQPQIAVDPSNPRHLVGSWQQDRWSGVGAHGLVTIASFDGGARWTTATPAMSVCSGGDYWRATDSVVSIAPNGYAYVVSLSMNTVSAMGDHAILVSRSRTGGVRWESPVTLVREGTAPDQFVFNDLPSVTADPTDSRYVYVTWDRIVAPPLGGPIHLARSVDRGATWQPHRPIVDPGVNAVAAGSKIVVLPNGTLVVFYSVTTYDQETFAPTGMSFQVARSVDKGRTWSAPILIAEADPVGTTVPDSGVDVRDGSAFAGQIAVGPNGILYAAWQNALASGVRDGIVLSRSTDGGRTWSTPRLVSPRGGQAFSPALAVTEDGAVGVTYSTLTGGSSAVNWIAQSVDRGRTWTERRITRPFDLAVAPVVESPPGALYVGDYHGMVAAGRRFVSIFPLTNDDPANRTDIFVSTDPARRPQHAGR